MFERLISDLLNRFLGTYIENLDSSKLKISIWGGDVELTNLIVKQSALDELNLPIKCVCGYIEHLALKIPWSKLYTEKWEALVDGLVLVIVPTSSVKYDEEKEKKYLQEVKQAALSRIELAKERQKLQESGLKQNLAEDGFIEKLMIQVVQNIQVEIKNIHIRYEDRITCPHEPFSFGFMLENLSLQSISQATSKHIEKQLGIKNLLLYWTSKSELFYNENQENAVNVALTKTLYADEIDNAIFGPVSLTSKLKLNPKPENDDVPYTAPKFDLNILLHSLNIGISRNQYVGFMNLLSSLNSLQKLSMYRKFRPVNHTVVENPRAWWRYAIQCKLDNIKRINRNWSWKYIREHRIMSRKYKSIYLKKLQEFALNSEEIKLIEFLEIELDLFNITLARKQAETEFERKGGKKNVQKKGWFSSFFSSAPVDQSEQSIVSQIQTQMSSEEKHKLYEAIGYTEDTAVQDFPVHYNDVQIFFVLETAEVKFSDELLQSQTVCTAQIQYFMCTIFTRSAASALNVQVSMRSFEVEGLKSQSESETPKIIDSINATETLFESYLETNPQFMDCDTYVKISAQGLSVRYHVDTFVQLIDMFSIPENVSLQQLQAAALNQYEIVKERSATGLQAAIDDRTKIVVDVNVEASRIIIPELGFYKRGTSMIIMSLGKFSINNTDNKRIHLIDVAQRIIEKDVVLETIRSSSYDEYAIKIEHIQVLVSGASDDWEQCLTSSNKNTSLHLLQPLSINVTFKKCLVVDDPNLPIVKIDASLPLIAFSIIDEKIFQAAVILTNCFKQQQAVTPKRDTDDFFEFSDQSKDENRNVINEDVALIRLEKTDVNVDGESVLATPQLIQLQFSFTIDEILFEVLKETKGDLNSVMRLGMKETSVCFTKRTFDLTINVILSKIDFEHMEWGCEPIMKSGPSIDDSKRSLLSLKITQVDKRSPYFETFYHGVRTSVLFEMSSVMVRLELKSLTNILKFYENFSARIVNIESIYKVKRRLSSTSLSGRRISKKIRRNSSVTKSFHGRTEHATQSVKHVEATKQPKFIDKYSASIGHVEVSLAKFNEDLLTMLVRGFEAKVMQTESEIKIGSNLKQFKLLDPNPASLYPNLVTVEGTNAYKGEIIYYVDHEFSFFDTNKCDVFVTVEFAKAKINYLHKNVDEVLNWIDHFFSARQAIYNASQAAAKRARENIKDLSSFSTKVKFDLLANAPVIYIPYNSTLKHGILLDLGKLRLTNKFERGNIKNEGGHPSIFDRITLTLFDLKVARKKHVDSPNERHILSPIELEVYVNRNLSISWHKTVPEINVTANLDEIKIKLNETDVGMIFSIIMSNFNESSSQSNANKEVKQVTPSIAFEEELEVIDENESLQSGPLFTKLKFEFEIKNVTLLLLSSPPDNVVPKNTVDVVNDVAGFALIALKNLMTSGIVTSDYNYGFNFSMRDCVVQDIRTESRNGITKMLSKKSKNNLADIADALIEINVEQKDLLVAVRITMFEMSVILHLPFLVKAQTFFDFQAPSQQTVLDSKEILNSNATKGTVHIERYALDVAETAQLTTRMQIKIKSPDIIFARDLADLNTACIFVHCELDCEVRLHSDVRNLSASVDNIQMYTSVYNEKKTDFVPSQILSKSKAVLSSSCSSVENDQIFVHVSSLNFILAPGTLALVMDIINSILVNGQSTERSKTESEKDLSNLWTPKSLDFEVLSFLNIDVADEAEKSLSETETGKEALSVFKNKSKATEKIIVEFENILITVETGGDSVAFPLLKMQSECSFEAINFYSPMISIFGSCSFESTYYNERQAIWEPFIEPVYHAHSDEKFQPWNIKFECVTNFDSKTIEGSTHSSNSSSLTLDRTDNAEFEIMENILPPKIRISLIAKEPLNITITTSLLELLTSILETFSAAYQGSSNLKPTAKAQYEIINKTGLVLSICLEESGLNLATGRMNTDKPTLSEVILNSDESLGLINSETLTVYHRRRASLVTESQLLHKKIIKIKMIDSEIEFFIPVTKMDKRCFKLKKFKSKSAEKSFSLISAVTVKGGCKTVTLSGSGTLVNNLDLPVVVNVYDTNKDILRRICRVLPNSSALFPILHMRPESCELYFSIESYKTSKEPIQWEMMRNHFGFVKKMVCEHQGRKKSRDDFMIEYPFVFMAVCETEYLFYNDTNIKTADSIMLNISLNPCVTINNFLPLQILIDSSSGMEYQPLNPGHSFQINHSDIEGVSVNFKINDYNGFNLICSKKLSSNLEEFSIMSFLKDSGNSKDIIIELGLHTKKLLSYYHLSVYCPFWMINKTKSDLIYKSDAMSSFHGDANSVQAVLFSFRSDMFFGKKKSRVKIVGCEWSESFPLDTVGSAGAVKCRDPAFQNLYHTISISINLSSTGLTKIVTFSSFYEALNRCSYDLEYHIDGDKTNAWRLLKSGEYAGIWPLSETPALRIRVFGTAIATKAIHFDHSHVTLFKLKNKYGGVFVEVSESEGGTLISLDKCLDSVTTAVVINHLSDSNIKIWQEDHYDDNVELEAERMVHFTWESAASRRLLVVSYLGYDLVKIPLHVDGKGEIARGDVRWASWLAGAQRYVVVSTEYNVLKGPSLFNPFVQVDQEFEISLNQIGVSLVDDLKSIEIFYLCMTSSGIVWEYRKETGKRYKPFTKEQTYLIETGYSIYQNELKKNKVVEPNYNLKENLVVNYLHMSVSKPFRRKIRRVFQPGIWAQIQYISTEQTLHLKVNKFQLDNQMSSESVFPVVLCRADPRSGVSKETVPKPFFELSTVISYQSNLFTNYKYLVCLIQEFELNVELEFVFAILCVLYPEQKIASSGTLRAFKNDMKIIRADFHSMLSAAGYVKRDFFQHMHLSPIKMHLSFSLVGLDSTDNLPITAEVFRLFLRSIGVTLTQVQDVVFKLAFFQRENRWLNWEGVIGEVISHYTHQIVKQLYVLVLGLDVLGNPFGLVIGVTKGLGDLFYEPIQGAVEGPGEFLEGLKYGLGSILEKTVGGTAGAIHRITSSIGKGVASLTFDEEYKRKRRERITKSATSSTGFSRIAKDGKGILSGFFDGVTGVITKPITGAQEEGVEGFFKGVGKGVVGVITRPASSIIDFASGSFDVVKKATDMIEVVEPLRPPRLFDSDGIVKPYNEKRAFGNKLFKELEKGYYAQTDQYIDHAQVTAGHSTLFVSNKRVILVSKNDITGSWILNWSLKYNELVEAPYLTSSGIHFVVMEAKKFLGVFGTSNNNKTIMLLNQKEHLPIINSISEAYFKYQQ